MLRNVPKICQRKTFYPAFLTKRTFLTKDYKCTEAWSGIQSSPMINKVNLNDFYNRLDQNYSSKGVISAIDVDIFAHALNDQSHLEELKELLHKLRLSADTGNTLESTHQATIRNFINFGYLQELVEILKDPLNFGVFLDEYTANILLDELLKSQNYELAADVASLVMLQEDFSNELTCTLCKFSAYKYIKNYTPPEPAPLEDPKKKVEEIKIRIKFLRNPYYDDHFDIKDTITRSGKTLAWISEQQTDNLNNNLQIIGWLIYKKYDKLISLCKQLTKSSEFRLYNEVKDLINREKSLESDSRETLEKCSTILENYQNAANEDLEESIKTAIENAINKVHKRDVETQQKVSFVLLILFILILILTYNLFKYEYNTYIQKKNISAFPILEHTERAKT